MERAICTTQIARAKMRNGRNAAAPREIFNDGNPMEGPDGTHATTPTPHGGPRLRAGAAPDRGCSDDTPRQAPPRPWQHLRRCRHSERVRRHARTGRRRPPGRRHWTGSKLTPGGPWPRNRTHGAARAHRSPIAGPGPAALRPAGSGCRRLKPLQRPRQAPGRLQARRGASGTGLTGEEHHGEAFLPLAGAFLGLSELAN
jgi:hypothetical protein